MTSSQYTRRPYRPGELVHITCRGFRKQTIFFDGDDHRMFLEGFHELNELLPANERLSLMSYAQLSNHQHLFVRNGLSEWAITKLMHRLCTQYGMEFNWLHGRRGKVFQRPFRGKIIRSADHIASTFVYIHLNPDASLRMENSSHGIYAGLREDPRIDTSLAWQTFGGRDGYLEFFSDTARLRAARAAARRRLAG